jgi:MoxR-like ATPase
VHGLSPRAALALLSAARAWAFIDGRDIALPEDVQAVFASVAAHRLRLAQGGGHAAADDLGAMLRRIALP